MDDASAGQERVRAMSVADSEPFDIETPAGLLASAQLADLAGASDGGLPDGIFREIVESLPTALYTTDAEGRITFYNDAAAELWGRRPSIGTEWWCGSWRLYWPDGSPMAHDQCPMAIALKTGAPVRGTEAIAERPDGSRYAFVPYPTPLFTPTGQLRGAVNMLVDITERKQAEVATQRLAAIVASSDDAIVSKTLNGIVTSWNEAAERLFGYTPDEIIGQSILTLIPTDRHGEEAEIVGRIRAGQRVEHYETVRQRKDGSLFDISLTVSPIKRDDGTIIGASKIARDISERKRAEAQLAQLHEAAQVEIEQRKRAEDAKELLLHEIKHRVKNTLATVQAMATQTFRKAPAEEVQAFVARLHALSDAHDLLTQEDWDAVAVGHIVKRALRPFVEDGRERIATTGPDVQIDSSKALFLAMILHELGTNAVKYGALSNDQGGVHVSWETAEKAGRPFMKLRWRERGGPEVTTPTRKGFGSRMIERALRGQQGTVDFDYAPEGLVCILQIAL